MIPSVKPVNVQVRLVVLMHVVGTGTAGDTKTVYPVSAGTLTDGVHETRTRPETPGTIAGVSEMVGALGTAPSAATAADAPDAGLEPAAFPATTVKV